MSYRNGYVVKIRFNDVTFYPRMIANQLLGEDDYFLKAQKSWVSYAEAQAQQDQTPEKIEAAQLAVKNFEHAQKIHTLMAAVSEADLSRMMALFYELNKTNTPLCGQVIVELNERIAKKLGKNKTSLGLEKSDRLETDEIAKDVIFYQDIFRAFTDVAAQLIAK